MAGVTVSRRVLDKISRAIRDVENKREVGGVLLGYRRPHGMDVIDATVPGPGQFSDLVTFTINGEEETAKAAALCEAYRDCPEVIGLWHSHVGGIPTFSRQDRSSNQMFAHRFGQVLSCIAVPGADHMLKELVMYQVSPGQAEQRCPFTCGAPD